MNTNTKTDRFVEAWKYTKRGYGIVHRLDPSYMPIAALSGIIKAAQPLLYFMAHPE